MHGHGTWRSDKIFHKNSIFHGGIAITCRAAGVAGIDPFSGRAIRDVPAERLSWPCPMVQSPAMERYRAGPLTISMRSALASNGSGEHVFPMRDASFFVEFVGMTTVASARVIGNARPG